MWRPDEPSLSLASKGLVTPGHRGHRRPHRPALGPLRRHRGQPAARPGPDPGQPARSRRHGRRARLLRRHPRRSPTSAAAEIAAVDPFDETGYLAELGLDATHGEPGYRTLERLWERPTLEVNGVAGGGKYTVIPHVATGHVSCRLVPGQDPDAVMRGHRRARRGAGAAPGVRVQVRPDEARVPAYTIPAEPPGHPGRHRRAGGGLPRPAGAARQASAARCRPPTCSSGPWAPRRCSSRSRPRTRTCTPLTSSCACPGCARGCAPGSSCGGCWPPGRSASEETR